VKQRVLDWLRWPFMERRVIYKDEYWRRRDWVKPAVVLACAFAVGLLALAGIGAASYAWLGSQCRAWERELGQETRLIEAGWLEHRCVTEYRGGTVFAEDLLRVRRTDEVDG